MSFSAHLHPGKQFAGRENQAGNLKGPPEGHVHESARLGRQVHDLLEVCVPAQPAFGQDRRKPVMRNREDIPIGAQHRSISGANSGYALAVRTNLYDGIIEDRGRPVSREPFLDRFDKKRPSGLFRGDDVRIGRPLQQERFDRSDKGIG